MSAKVIPFPTARRALQSPSKELPREGRLDRMAELVVLRRPQLTSAELFREDYLAQVEETSKTIVAMVKEYRRTGKCRDPRYLRKE